MPLWVVGNYPNWYLYYRVLTLDHQGRNKLQDVLVDLRSKAAIELHMKDQTCQDMMEHFSRTPDFAAHELMHLISMEVQDRDE